MDKISRKNFDPKQKFLYYCRQPIGNDIYAIVRMAWLGKDGCGAVYESRINLYDKNVVMEFTDMVGDALDTGAEVCVICIDDPKNLGIEEV